MYGYESSLDYMPATEGKVGDWFQGVLAKIKKVGAAIRDFIVGVGNKIKHAIKNATNAAYAQDNATTIVSGLGAKISKLLDDCCDSIATLKSEYAKVGASDEGGNFDYDAHKGMGKLNKKADKAAVKNWNESKVTLAKTFKEYAKTATEIRNDISSINTKKLDVESLKAGYKQLKDIFVSNQKFANQWETVVMAHDWSTGKIRGYLGKVVKMYQTGVNAVNTYGRLLSKQGHSDVPDVDEVNGGTNYIKVSSDNKAMNAKNIRQARQQARQQAEQDAANAANSGNESASRIIDRLYQMAYEDARADLEEEQELLAIYDSIPEFEF